MDAKQALLFGGPNKGVALKPTKGGLPLETDEEMISSTCN